MAKHTSGFHYRAMQPPSVQFTIKVPSEVAEAVDTIARRNNQTRHSTLNSIIRDSGPVAALLGSSTANTTPDVAPAVTGEIASGAVVTVAEPPTSVSRETPDQDWRADVFQS